MKRKQTIRLGIAALLLGAAAGAWIACEPASPEELPPNIVLLVLDTVRADHVSCYGYERPTTPSIDALAEHAVRYTECRATGPWTLPSHASMFTGQFAFQHRADIAQDENGEWDDRPLAEEHFTLAEALGEMGYRTGGFVANEAFLREEFQLDQGFDDYEVKNEAGVIKNDTAFTWLEQNREPFFLFLNYMDAHRPYNVTPLENGRMSDLSWEGEPTSVQLLRQMYGIVLANEKTPPAKLVEQLTACYDLGVANADVAVGGVIAELKRRGLWENTLLIVTSDHGEFLGEHGLVEHSKDIYEQTLHVPLIVKFPGSEETRVETSLVSLADLPRIVASAMPAPLRDELHDLYPLAPDRGFLLAEINMTRKKDLNASYGHRFRRKRDVFYADVYKLIRSSDAQHELYDLRVDPEELNNLYTEKSELVEQLTRRLEQYIRDHPAEHEAAQVPEPNAAMTDAMTHTGYAGEDRDKKKPDQE